jgi:hypothetical protein
MSKQFTFDGDGYLMELPPNDAGRYHLCDLGWYFTAGEGVV